MLLAQITPAALIDLTPAPRVTWHDLQQPLLPLPQQRVTIEQLPDNGATIDTTALAPTTRLQQPAAYLPPPPWTPYDIASVRGTAITTSSAAFNNPATSDRATELAARIHSLETELQRSRDYYSSS